MKLVFIKYNAYNAKGAYFNSNDFKNIQSNISKFPKHYRANRFNRHWDSSCRPDPDFHNFRPSTGLCRNKANGKSGIQTYLGNLKGTDHLVFYFYEDKQSNIVISAVFKVCNFFNTHTIAYKNKLKSLNVVSNNFNYRNCINNIVNGKNHKPVFGQTVNKCNKYYSNVCTECNDNYYKKYNSNFIEYRWYHKDNADDLASSLKITPYPLPKGKFIDSIVMSGTYFDNGTINIYGGITTNISNNGKRFGYQYKLIGKKLEPVDTSGNIIILPNQHLQHARRKYDFQQIQGCGIEVDLTSTGFSNLSITPQSSPVNVLTHILTKLAAGAAI